jgi:hypothetical protein
MVPSDMPEALTDRFRLTVDPVCVTDPTTDNELAAADALTAVETTCAALLLAMPFAAAADAGDPNATTTRIGAAAIDRDPRRRILASNFEGFGRDMARTLDLLGTQFSGFCDKFQAAVPRRALAT